ncbi:LOW QUALITY PROTEIN: uncharacterized protein LOC124428994 [Vespa crabro]|uniref:LOW QUALITY PROTEIN: uncharacterized protein LOC124428994 n=1 Tax=Vespa crabro TaxID=7445 RepID=UPI001F01C17F|nr:LOW QUALITY PROTEIN: uncharacterized protein LOC124428994 [Vespa crabro]
MSTNRLRSSSVTNKRSPKIGENTRKNTLRASSTLDTGWSQNLHSHPLRSTASNIYQPNTCSSEHDLKRSEEKTSEETILIEVDGNIDDYLTNPDIKNLSVKQKNDAFLRRNHRYIYDYPNVSQAMLAMQKLQKLKELQRRRDLTEKYYSHEIRKLIGDYFNANPRTELSSLKYNNNIINNYNNNNNNNNNNRIQNSNFLQPYLGDRLKNDIKVRQIILVFFFFLFFFDSTIRKCISPDTEVYLDTILKIKIKIKKKKKKIIKKLNPKRIYCLLISIPSSDIYPSDRVPFEIPRLILSLEPCGTMTTITRLDCGCIQETTRPIFTTTTGRVQKKTCNQSQDQVLLKLTSTNPQELLCSSVEPNKLEQYSQRSKKKRIGIESRNYVLNSIDVVDRKIEKEHDLHNPENVQVLRKYSDTSTTSI